jgi:hypothetical protein
MGFRISSYTLIKAVSLAHITAAYLFLYRPTVLAEQNIVVILGESMHVVSPLSLQPLPDTSDTTISPHHLLSASPQKSPPSHPFSWPSSVSAT